MRNGHVFNIIVCLFQIWPWLQAMTQNPLFFLASGAKALGDILVGFGRHDGEKSLQDGGRVGSCRFTQFQMHKHPNG